MKKNCFGTMFWLLLRNDCIPGTDLSSQRAELFTSCPGSLQLSGIGLDMPGLGI